jgi:hypothetical protein
VIRAARGASWVVGRAPLALTAEVVALEEFRLLQVKFSTGVTLKELRSVSTVLVRFGGIKPPGKAARRRYNDLVKWYIANWAAIAAWLPFISLRDQYDGIIDGQREAIEKLFGLFW